MDQLLNLTPSAVQRLKTLLAQSSGAGKRFRVRIESGGCNGFQYHFNLDDAQQSDDIVIEAEEGVQVIIDEASLDLIKGATIDFIEDLMGYYFQIKNPNSTSSCGCGNSFAL